MAIAVAIALMFFQSNVNGQVKTYSVEENRVFESNLPQTPVRKILDQNSHSLELEFEFNSFNVHEILADDGEIYQLFRMNSFGLTNQVGSPAHRKDPYPGKYDSCCSH